MIPQQEALDPAGAPPPPPIPARLDRQRVGGWVASRLPLLEAMLEGAVADLSSELPAMREAVELAVGTRGRGGRRWRPLLTLAAAEACGTDPTGVLGVAAAVELTHTASLVLDDLPCMDDSPERRGLPATHRLVGSSGAVLVAMGLLGRAAELMARSPVGAAELCSAWGEALGLRGMSGGQVVDLKPSEGRHRGELRRLHRRKTTALSILALSAGARASGAPEPSRRALEGYGQDLGWAYQLADDVQDRWEDAERGLRPGGRRPLRQSRYLVDRAIRRLHQCEALAPEGRDLLVSFARVVVPAPPLTLHPPRGKAVTRA